MANASRRLGVTAALAGAALLLSGAVELQPALAHDDSHGASSHTFAAGEPVSAGTPDRIIEIVMREGDGSMSYSPPRIEVRKGELVKFVLKNAGQLRHEVLIDSFENNAKHKAQMAKSPGMEHKEPNGRELDPGHSAELLWRFTQAGTFEYACLIPGHYESGMKGVIVVK